MNGILLVDKPQGFTSHDVIAKLRGILHERRIGHSGTLDPMATGLLVVYIGRSTRAVQFAENHDKEYIAGIRFGVVTDTQDITGTVLERSDLKISEKQLRAVFPEFIGEIMQLPPMYSAIKIKGQKLCDIARKGGEVDRKRRPVKIYELSFIDKKQGDYLLKICCSKGTYVRTLCHDIGARLEAGAALSSLRRTKSGCFDVIDALTLQQVEGLAEQGKLETGLIPVDKLFEEYPTFTMNDNQRKRCICGSNFYASLPDGKYRVYDSNGMFMMFAEANNSVMSVIKSFFEVDTI